MTSIIEKKFEKGLIEYDVSFKEIVNEWKYAGGNKNRHLNYFKMMFPTKNIPKEKEKCICGHSIQENCYITDKNHKYILVLGNCCIKRFLTNSGRTCEECGSHHQNRKLNLCNVCKVGICYDCRGKCDDRYNRCFQCYLKRTT